MRFRAYGIILESDVPLPELSRAEDDATPSIRLRLGGPPEPVELPREWFFADSGIRAARYGEGYLYDFYGAAFFRLDATGSEITLVRSDASVGPDLLRHFVLDHVLPRSFNLPGDEVVHATAVRTPRGVCAFVGPSGLGKSTLAASFGAAGHPVLADDCLILREAAGEIVATPGYPGVRLLEDAIAAIVDDSVATASIAEDYEKRRVVMAPSGAEQDTPLPLSRIYILRRVAADARPSIVPLSGREAFIGLVMGNTLRFNPHDRAASLRELAFFERVVSLVRVKSCGVPEGLAALPTVRAAILADLRPPSA